MPSSQDRPSVGPPADHRVVNAPTTAMALPRRPGQPGQPPGDFRDTTAPVPTARHAAPPDPDRWPPVPNPTPQIPAPPNPAPTDRFNRPTAASPRLGAYSPPAAYSATRHPAQPNPVQPSPAQPYSAQSSPAQPYSAQSSPAQPYPAQPYPAGPARPQAAYRPAGVEVSPVRMTTTTQRPHRRVDTSVLCAAAALVLLAFAVLVGLML